MSPHLLHLLVTTRLAELRQRAETPTKSRVRA